MRSTSDSNARKSWFSARRGAIRDAVRIQRGNSEWGEGGRGDSGRSFREKQHLKWDLEEWERFGWVDIGERRLGRKVSVKRSVWAKAEGKKLQGSVGNGE